MFFKESTFNNSTPKTALERFEVGAQILIRKHNNFENLTLLSAF